MHAEHHFPVTKCFQSVLGMSLHVYDVCQGIKTLNASSQYSCHILTDADTDAYELQNFMQPMIVCRSVKKKWKKEG